MRYITHYEVLQIPHTATDDDVRRAFRALSKMHHPDAGGNRARFEQVVTAHRILASSEQRRAYDVYLAERNDQETRALAARQEASRYYDDRNDQVFVEEELYDAPFEHPVRHFLGYLVVLVALLAVILGPAWIALRTSNDDDVAAEAVPAVVEAVEDRHNGLDVPQSSLRWLVAYQALSGTSPLTTVEDSVAVYNTSQPGDRCDEFTRPRYWSLLAPDSLDLAVIQDALNHDFARAIAECNNFDDILPAITGTLIVDTATLAARFRKIEALADEAVFTPGGV